MQWSHPSRVCGLKFERFVNFLKGHLVAPFAGVWIEIIQEDLKGIRGTCRTLRGCVD